MLQHGSSLPLAQVMLGQIELLTPPPTLPSLADPPALQHALLENPVPPVILMVALGLAAYAIASRLGRPRAGLLGAGLGLLLGGAAVLTSVLVETTRERLTARTAELVGAVAGADGRALDGLLADDVRMYVRGEGSGWAKGRIVEWVERYLAPGSIYAVGAHRVTETQAEVGTSGRIGRTRATVRVEPEQGGPTLFLCMLTWQEVSAGEWVVIEIDPLWVQGYGEISGRTLRETPRW